MCCTAGNHISQLVSLPLPRCLSTVCTTVVRASVSLESITRIPATVIITGSGGQKDGEPERERERLRCAEFNRSLGGSSNYVFLGFFWSQKHWHVKHVNFCISKNLHLLLQLHSVSRPQEGSVESKVSFIWTLFVSALGLNVNITPAVLFTLDHLPEAAWLLLLWMSFFVVVPPSSTSLHLSHHIRKLN